MDKNEFIVIDTAHDFNNVTIHMLDAASHIILMMAPEMASLRSAVCALSIYDRLGFPADRIFVAVNQTFDMAGIKQGQIEKVLRRSVDMMIPYVQGEFIRSINFGEPFISKNPDLPISGLYEDAAYWLSNEIHKNFHLSRRRRPGDGWSVVYRTKNPEFWVGYEAEKHTTPDPYCALWINPGCDQPFL